MTKETKFARTKKEKLIFDAALKIIKEKGFHQARMSDIAKEAGISYGLVYHYFKNKEDLFETILNQWWGGLFDILEGLRNSRTDVREKLGKIVQYYLGTYHRYPELVTIFITEISRSSTNLTPERLKKFMKLMSRTDAVMTEGQKGGLLRKDVKPRYLTYIFLGALETFISAMVLVDQSLTKDSQVGRLGDAILDVFMNGAKSG
ncbi:MAG: TetR/AcrR family transcriptional regulator [Deltaproteobacteria bacterium]|nr:TetR/AcrR family transcriptional regulator [Deltaproteobacteria bacterium]